MQKAIEEAKKMREINEANSDPCSHFDDWCKFAYNNIIERLEAKASLPQEPTTDELLEELRCNLECKYWEMWIAEKYIKWILYAWYWKTPREAILNLKEKLITQEPTQEPSVENIFDNMMGSPIDSLNKIFPKII